MRAVIQRCARCEVQSEGKPCGRIGQGLVVLLGVQQGDTEKDADYMVDKILHLRIFEDGAGKLNRSVMDISGGVMIVSQFTLLGDCRHGRRPGFSEAAEPVQARKLYEYAAAACRNSGLQTETGRFQTDMTVSLDNTGPVTILLDSRRLF